MDAIKIVRNRLADYQSQAANAEAEHMWQLRADLACKIETLRRLLLELQTAEQREEREKQESAEG